MHGANIKTSDLTCVWLYARNAKASIEGKVDEDHSVSYEISVGTKHYNYINVNTVIGTLISERRLLSSMMSNGYEQTTVDTAEKCQLFWRP